MPAELSRRSAAEGLGTAFLVATVVGSGIMAERLAGGSVALALLANTIATAAMLVALILALGSVSGAHFNPAVTLAEAGAGGLPWRDVPAYLISQLAGAFSGTLLAHAMFGEPLVALSTHVRASAGERLAEFVATFGLLSVIRGCARSRPDAVAWAVAAYIAAAYWFTSSTSFANPAVTLARSVTDSFSGIRPADVPAFIAMQLAGAAAASALFAWLGAPAKPNVADASGEVR